MCDEILNPIFVTRDDKMLSWAKAYTTLFGMYFIYDYDVGEYDVYFNFCHRTTQNTFTQLAQHCELAERYVFYTPSNDTFQVVCGGRVYINGYATNVFIWDEEVRMYEIGYVYIASRKVQTHEEDIDVMTMLELSKAASIETTNGIWQILTGVERQETLATLRSHGFTVDRSVVVDDMTFHVLTGNELNPFTLYRYGEQIDVPMLYVLKGCLKRYNDVSVYNVQL